jgi:hypothetical protein
MASDASQSAKFNPPVDEDDLIPPLLTRKRKGRDSEITAKKLKQFMWTDPTAEVTSLYFDVGIQPLYRYIKRHWGLTFEQFRDKNLQYTRHLLTQKAIDQAVNKNNTAALIFCLKNLCGWRDSVEVTPGAQPAITLRYSLDAPPPPPEPPRDVTPTDQSESA